MDLYKILKIKKNATLEQIKSSYRKLSKKHHPDVKGDPERFNEITIAYKVLIDKKKRKDYDDYGIIENNKLEVKIKNDARNNIAQLLKSIMNNKQLMQDHHKVDILDIMVSSIENNRLKMKSSISELNREIKNIRGLITKFTYDGKEDNLLISVLKTEISDKELIIRNMNHELAVIKEMKKILKNYTYELEELIIRNITYTSFNDQTTSTMF
jgi:DnaJ-class molecular chaperone